MEADAMRDVIAGWVGKEVTVTLGVGEMAGAVPMSGTLFRSAMPGC
jgi:hypothetical protein